MHETLIYSCKTPFFRPAINMHFKKGIPQPHRSGVSYGIPLITYYPSIAIYFFSGSFSASFFGIESFRTPSSNLAFTSSCFTASPT